MKYKVPLITLVLASISVNAFSQEGEITGNDLSHVGFGGLNLQGYIKYKKEEDQRGIESGKINISYTFAGETWTSTAKSSFYDQFQKECGNLISQNIGDDGRTAIFSGRAIGKITEEQMDEKYLAYNEYLAYNLPSDIRPQLNDGSRFEFYFDMPSGLITGISIYRSYVQPHDKVVNAAIQRFGLNKSDFDLGEKSSSTSNVSNWGLYATGGYRALDDYYADYIDSNRSKITTTHGYNIYIRTTSPDSNSLSIRSAILAPESKVESMKQEAKKNCLNTFKDAMNEYTKEQKKPIAL
ncbi:hypothetical protein FE810_15420 [Thalassotalea litorea]|uniref:Uncharacterized protein n=1 Tax=Thalassotalea litorea TaxID=2020715 RepID=A0A5R9IF18_9GAMM|nr:hypothetical protein [Thalassotalea litorea]TLU61210.1 hypothetical protein FE810_15420 [Thalassotalea litorea]